MKNVIDSGVAKAGKVWYNEKKTRKEAESWNINMW